MHALKYQLTDGTIVTTLKEAQTSGQGYKAFIEEISEASTPLSPVRQAMLKKYGKVDKDKKGEFIDLLV